jgi:hypothetical protein
VDQLNAVESERTAVVRALARTDPLTVGSLSEIQRRCGKPGCHCSERPGHLQNVLMSVADGRRRCQVIRQDDLPIVRKTVQRYRDFREGLRHLRTLDLKVLTLLKRLMKLRAKTYK